MSEFCEDFLCCFGIARGLFRCHMFENVLKANSRKVDCEMAVLTEKAIYMPNEKETCQGWWSESNDLNWESETEQQLCLL